MREVEYNFQLWQFQQEITAKVSAVEPSRKSSWAFFYLDTLTFLQSKETRERYLKLQFVDEHDIHMKFPATDAEMGLLLYSMGGLTGL